MTRIWSDKLVIECQGCGEVMKRPTPEEAKHVAERPYDYVWFCRPCKKRGLHIEEQFR